jgi:hypothetical protein
MSELVVGWLLLDAAVVAHDAGKALPESHPDHAFYTGKRYTATYFAHNLKRRRPLGLIDEQHTFYRSIRHQPPSA